MRNRTQHGLSRLTAISDAGSTPAASTMLIEKVYGASDSTKLVSTDFWHGLTALSCRRSGQPNSLKPFLNAFKSIFIAIKCF